MATTMIAAIAWERFRPERHANPAVNRLIAK
jgi:hypothetical protein